MEIYDLVQKIEKMREERGWSTYRLAEEAQITPSTMFNMHTRGTLPSVTTLYSICNAFGISMSEFFADGGEDKLSETERDLIEKYRKMSFRDKRVLVCCADALSDDGRCKKSK